MMAPKQTPTDTPAATDAPPPDAPQTDAPTTPEFTWGTLIAPIASPNVVVAGNRGANVMEKIPAPIRERAERSLMVNAARVAAGTKGEAKRPRIDYHWDVQPVPTAELGAEFVKMVVKYAKYRPAKTGLEFAGPDSPAGQVTARCGDPQHYVIAADGKPEACSATTEGAFIGVRYSVRPFQARTDAARAPGSA